MRKSFLLLSIFLFSCFSRVLSASLRDPFVSLLPQEKIGENNKREKNVGSIKDHEPIYIKDEGEFSDFQLEGIIWLQKRPVVIINGRVYKKGDSIEKGAKITKIKKGEVYIYYQDRIYILSLRNKIKLEVK